MDRRDFLAGSLSTLVAAPAAAATKPLFRDDFRSLRKWTIESEAPGKIVARKGLLDIDVPKGCSLWFRECLTAPVAIEVDVTAISAGGPNDAVSDVNFFWMATDPNGGSPIGQRHGAFAEYDTLKTYYAGIGGNRNTSSRLRRYVGRAGVRPILPQHDLSAPEDLLVANRESRFRIEVVNGLTRLIRDGETMFTLYDGDLYRSGWFAIRTTQSHLQVKRFRVWRL